MTTVYTEIKIEAKAAAVWEELMDFDSYSEWNPLVEYLGGKPTLGEKLDLKINLPSGSSFAVKPKVLENSPNKKFQWIGKLVIPGVFDGKHSFELSEENDGTGVVLRHYEEFSGILKHPMGWFGIYKKTRPGFELMNEQLKKRVEEKLAKSRA